MTINELFTHLEDSIIEGNDVIVSYNKEYGYPERYQICPEKYEDHIDNSVGVAF